MVKIKRLADKTDPICHIEPNISLEELDQRKRDYETLSDKKMRTTYLHSAFRPVHLHWNEKEYEIQLNFCSDPFCKNFNEPQVEYNVGKIKRYKFTGTDSNRSIHCVPDPTDKNGIPTLGCYTRTFSNWSLATEIERLIHVNTVVPLEKEYVFHKDGCSETRTYFESPKSFYKRGTATSKAQIVQCKTCKKYTNVLPDKTRTTTYTQKRNDVLPQFAKNLLGHVPVASTSKILNIGRSTFYSKLKWLYRCCLEFLETHETKEFSKRTFPRMRVNTDMMMYYLNNIRKKGQPKTRGMKMPEKQLPTQVVISADSYSRYVLRADVAYDWDIDFKQIEEETKKYNDDHMPNELRKNAKYTNYSYYPMKPTENDNQTSIEYQHEKQEFLKRERYVDGLHVNHTYTAMAHMFLIKEMVNTDKWRIVSDNDASLKAAAKKIFAEEIKQGKLHYFVNTFDKEIEREDAFSEYLESTRYLREWAEDNNFEDLSEYEQAVQLVKRELVNHKFYESKITHDGKSYNVSKSNKMEHPIAMTDRGNRYIDVVTDTSSLSEEHLARLIVRANDNAVNAFLQEIRRCISFLERPLVTSMGDGKSYIYANFNPKYAQMAITILRTYYNFCETIEFNGVKQTPAQRLGIADKVYDWHDIIYKR